MDTSWTHRPRRIPRLATGRARLAAGRAGLAAAVALTAAGGLLGCSLAVVDATWQRTPTSVDGIAADWPASELLPDTAITVSASNDGETLHLGLRTGDPRLLRLVALGGLTLWLDPRGGKDEVLGVRFPLPASAPRGRRGQRDEAAQPPAARLDGLELLGPQRQTRRWVAAPGNGGVRVALSLDGGELVYELAVPLGRDANGWGLGVEPGDVVGVGLRTSRPALAGGRGPGAGRVGGPGGRGGGRRGGGPPPGGMTGGPRGSRPDEAPRLDVWTRVRLAVPGSAAGGS